MKLNITYPKLTAATITSIQIFLLCCYYFDDCRENKHIECSSDVAMWQLWEVWIPTILSVSVFGGAFICGCCYTVFNLNARNAHIHARFRTNYKGPDPTTFV